MSQRRFDLVRKSQLVITPGIVQPPEAMGLQEDSVAELHPRSVNGSVAGTNTAEEKERRSEYKVSV